MRKDSGKHWSAGSLSVLVDSAAKRFDEWLDDPQTRQPCPVFEVRPLYDNTWQSILACYPGHRDPDLWPCSHAPAELSVSNAASGSASSRHRAEPVAR